MTHELATIPTSVDEGYTTEASAAGLAPGEWPDTIEYEGVPFRQMGKRFDREGDLTWVKYSSGSLILTVWND
jgi:hypothetical protein